jgi:hypothetical protein
MTQILEDISAAKRRVYAISYFRKRPYSGMLRPVVWKKLTEVSEVLSAYHHQDGQFLPDYMAQHPVKSHLHTRRRENLNYYQVTSDL